MLLVAAVADAAAAAAAIELAPLKAGGVDTFIEDEWSSSKSSATDDIELALLLVPTCSINALAWLGFSFPNNVDICEMIGD